MDMSHRLLCFPNIKYSGLFIQDISALLEFVYNYRLTRKEKRRESFFIQQL